MIPLPWTVFPNLASAFDSLRGAKKRAPDLFPFADENEKGRTLRTDEKSGTTTSTETVKIEDLVVTCSLTFSETVPSSLGQERRSGWNVIAEFLHALLQLALRRVHNDYPTLFRVYNERLFGTHQYPFIRSEDQKIGTPESCALKGSTLGSQDHALVHSRKEVCDTHVTNSTVAARAWDFAAKVAANHRHLISCNPDDPSMIDSNFSPLPPDAMSFLTERLFAMQDEFRKQGKNVHVDIGYHYTKSECMERIQTDGLLTKAERQAANIRGGDNGSSFGDGIYTAMNAYSFWKFGGGDQGLLVARLQGRIWESSSAGTTKAVVTSGIVHDVDTVFGRARGTDAICVLRSSAQCVALAMFSADLIELYDDTSVQNNLVHTYHCSLQGIVDDCFNGGIKTLVPKLLPSQTKVISSFSRPFVIPAPPPPDPQYFIKYRAPETLSFADVSQAFLPVEVKDETNAECPICCTRLLCEDKNGPAISLADCTHQFHQRCVENSVKLAHRCPLCHVPIGATQGTMPSGTMEIEFRSDLDCCSYAVGTIMITYEIFEGVQKAYHENPGEKHDSTVRIAYLPDCVDGRNLLKRLKFAFHRGLTFTVKTSLSTGQPNSVTWSSIHHKTSLLCGPHGYPDADYFLSVNHDLDARFVPSSHNLRE